mmetsp:Transcript_75496/g.234245  ORF Transcript_75496/g.234245 Transcript_75496/m.234245 type:complete len:448 (+) Transcript_75496:74-1417(+)
MPSEPAEEGAAGLVSVFAEVLRLAGSDDSAAGAAVAAAGRLTGRELEEIRTLRSPPVVVRRTLEATFLLLNTRTANGPFAPPAWQRVQKMLAEGTFLARMREYDATSLRESPALAQYIAAEYFGGNSGCASPRGRSMSRTRSTSRSDFRSASPSPVGRRATWAANGKKLSAVEEPLTYQRVLYASHAAAALFGWCTATLVDALELPVPGLDSANAATEEGHSPDVAGEPPAELPAELPAEPPAEPPAEVPAEPPAEPQAELPAELQAKPPRELPRAQMPKVSPPRAAPRPAADPPPAAQPVLPEVMTPDRHFEILCCFDLGYAGLTEAGEPALQTVAAVMCMRRNLVLELLGCPAAIENEALSKSRLEAVMNYFSQNGLAARASLDPPRVVSADSDPGIICQILLNNDRELRDYFILRELGEAFAIGGYTKSVVETLELDFQMRRRS